MFLWLSQHVGGLYFLQPLPKIGASVKMFTAILVEILDILLLLGILLW